MDIMFINCSFAIFITDLTQTLNLDWRPLFRDAFVYGLSIAVFIGFAWDGKFQWWEALILLLLYIGYIVIMKFNPHLLKFLEKIECKWCRYDVQC